MSRQGGGPRNYVHKDLHNQIVGDLKDRIVMLEGAISKLLFSPIGDARTVAVRVDYAREAHELIGDERKEAEA